MTSLVVLGGADGAITTVRAARRIGLRTICVDQKPDAPAVGLADEHLHVSTRDSDRLAELLAGRAELAGVVSPASDVNLPTQLLLARRLGLPCGLSDTALRASLDKGFFRDLCDRLGQPGPRFVQGPPEQVVTAVDALTLPVIVKPTDASGGRGIRLCQRSSQVPAAVRHAAAASAVGVVIIEEYLLGTHYSAEAIVRDGRIALFGLGRRELTPLPHFVTVRHTMPGAPAVLVDRARRMLQEAVSALAYRWGSLNADLLVTDDGRLILVEMGARLGGNGSAELLSLVGGVDVTEVSLQMAIGGQPELPSPGPVGDRCAAVWILTADRPGTLVDIHGLAEARALPGVVDLVVSADPGDPVEPYHRAGAKVGYVLVAEPGPGELAATLAELTRLLRVEVTGAAAPAGGHPPADPVDAVGVGPGGQR
jgi:biotin carboxylase